MTLKQIEDVMLIDCTDCAGTGYITVGRYDDEQVVECICRKNERLAKEESLAE